MAQPVTIRAATVNDYSRCLPLFDSFYHGDLGADFKRCFEDYVSTGLILVAEQSRRLVGVLVGSFRLDIDWEGRTATLDALVVDETHRKGKVGTSLVRRFVSAAQRRRCKAIKSRVNKTNTQAQSFHESLGFTRLATYEYAMDLEERH
jgi:ribosomal protein S18 acetylase RimI-like enzyme